MSLRVYVLGTDTAVGKTSVACNLLRRAAEVGLTIVPYKPAQSGDAPGDGDIARLLRAADLDPSLHPRACPYAFEPPVAPGIADDVASFLPDAPPPVLGQPFPSVLAHLEDWEHATKADVTLVEGAGGLHVPMPGGTWQPEWVRRVADAVVLVARAGLGTINHTLLTIDAVRSLGVPLLGVYFVHTPARDENPPNHDPSRATNPAVVARARAVPVLGIVPPLPDPDRADLDLLSPLLPYLPMQNRAKTRSSTS